MPIVRALLPLSEAVAKVKQLHVHVCVYVPVCGDFYEMKNESSDEDECGPTARKAARMAIPDPTTGAPLATLHCADCVAVMAAQDKNSAQLVLADPPYENVVDANWDKVDDYIAFSRRWLAEATRVLRPGGALLIYGSPERTWIARLTVMLEDEFKMNVVQTLCWVYSQGGGSRVSSMSKLAVQHELILWTEKPGGRRIFNAADCVEHYREDERAVALAKGKGRVSGDSLDRGRPPRSFLDFPRENSRSNERKYGNHPSMKPLALCDHLVKLYSNPGGTVVVPFAGSGSELLSAAKLRRNAVGAEVSVEYCSLIKRRFAGHGVPALYV